jgi:hypothetical protein
LRYGVNSDEYLGPKKPPTQPQSVAPVATTSSLTILAANSAGSQQGQLEPEVKRVKSEKSAADRIKDVIDNSIFWAAHNSNRSSEKLSSKPKALTLPKFIQDIRNSSDISKTAQTYLGYCSCIRFYSSESERPLINLARAIANNDMRALREVEYAITRLESVPAASLRNGPGAVAASLQSRPRA